MKDIQIKLVDLKLYNAALADSFQRKKIEAVNADNFEVASYNRDKEKECRKYIDVEEE